MRYAWLKGLMIGGVLGAATSASLYESYFFCLPGFWLAIAFDFDRSCGIWGCDLEPVIAWNFAAFIMPGLAIGLAIDRFKHLKYRWPRCRSCGYNMSFNTTGFCPICETRVPSEHRDRS